MQASWVMDLHAHLSNYEVIGLLGGTWDSENKRIQVMHFDQRYPNATALVALALALGFEGLLIRPA